MFDALKKITFRPKTYEVAHNRTHFGGDGTEYPKTFTDVVVCVSPDAQNYFTSKLPDVPTVVIPNGVDTTVFKPATGDKKTNRSRLLGGYVGRLEAGDGKGVPKLVEVISQLPIDFELVGTDYGGYSQYLQDRSIKNIRILPFNQSPVTFYHNWDFFASASPSEGFGLSIAEALSSGLPSVVWNCGGICHYLEHKKHAWVADTHEDFINGFWKLIRGELKLEPEGVDFSAKKMAESYEKLYQDLLSEKYAADKPKVKTAVIPGPTNAKSDLTVGITDHSWWGVRRALKSITDVYTSPEEAINLLRQLRPKLVVFGCYQQPWERVLLEARQLGCKTALTWHASYVLNEFDNINREWMHQSLVAAKRGHFDFVATPHSGLAQTWTKLGVETSFLPNVVEKEQVKVLLGMKGESSVKPPYHLGIFGSGQPWKNMDCQIMAGAMIPNSRIHIQNLKHAQSVDTFGIYLQKHPHFKNDLDYFKAMQKMSVNLCVSLSEVYSYFVAESLLVGTPVVTGSITPILKDAPKELQLCRTPYFEDPVEIAKVIERVIDNYSAVRLVGRDYMCELNAINAAIAEKTLDRWLDRKVKDR